MDEQTRKELVDLIHRMEAAGVPEEQIAKDVAAAKKMDAAGAGSAEILQHFQDRTTLKAGPVDRSQGAPAGVRAMIGPPSRKPEDRLAAARKYYPDARFQGEDIVYTDKGKRFSVNPEGLDLGDVAEYGRIPAEMIGGAIGGAAGAFGSTPTGFTAAPVMVPAGVGLGAGIAGGLYDAALEHIYGRPDTRSMGRRAIDTALDVGLNAAGQSVGDVAAIGLRDVLTRPGAIGRLTAFEAAEVPIEGAGAAIAGGQPAATASNVLEWLPGSHNMMAGARDETLGGVKNRLYALADRQGEPGTMADVSMQLRQGAERVGEKFKATQNLLRERMLRNVGDDAPVRLNSVRKLYKDLLAKKAKAPETSTYLDPTIAKIEDLLVDAGSRDIKNRNLLQIPFGSARSKLTDIGESLKATPMTTGYAGSEGTYLKRLYGALREDLGETAARQGPQAKQSFDRYFNYVRGMTEGKTSKLPVAERVLAQDEDKLYQWVVTGGNAGAKRVERVLRGAPKTARDNFRATFVQRLGMSNPSDQSAAGSEFSVTKFMTDYNKLQPEARAAVFGERSQIRADLDRLANAADYLKGVEKQKNVSRTARENFYANLFTTGGVGAVGGGVGAVLNAPLAAAGAVASAAGAYFTPKLAAKLMTSPKFIRWLAQGTKMSNPRTWQRHVARLVTLLTTDDELKQYINQSEQQ